VKQDGIVNLATGTATKLAPTGGDFRYPQAWSPDGRYLAVSGGLTGPEGLSRGWPFMMNAGDQAGGPGSS
jgi:Tol biopolymer transport system component